MSSIILFVFEFTMSSRSEGLIISNLFSLQSHIAMDPDEIQIFVKGIEGKSITIEIQKV